MVEILSAVVGALVTLITAGGVAYSKFKTLKDAHEEKLLELQTAKEVALADANTKIKEAEDKRQNEAFDRLSTAFDGQIKLYNDLLNRMQKVEQDHTDCQANLKEVRAEIEELKKKG